VRERCTHSQEIAVIKLLVITPLREPSRRRASPARAASTPGMSLTDSAPTPGRPHDAVGQHTATFRAHGPFGGTSPAISRITRPDSQWRVIAGNVLSPCPLFT
jgi:hypothetical protein